MASLCLVFVIFACFTGQASSASDIGEVCTSDADCNNGVCKFDSSNNAVKRCRCPFGKIESSTGCANIIHTDIDSSCQACETNGGTCIDQDQNDVKDGCVCPVFRSGADCVTSYVTVTCNATSFTMGICYTPQPMYNAVTPVMITEGSSMDPACCAVVADSSDTLCSTGQHKLILPLAEATRGRCGTQKMLSDISTIKYENRILVQTHFQDLHHHDVSFRTSCCFDTHANTRFDPIGLAVANADDKGSHHQATLTLSVENHLGIAIPAGVALRLGDKIRFKILLTLDGTYTAIRVARCIASTSPTKPDSNAITLPLVLASCPASGQTHITTSNNWGQISGNAHQLQTGLVPMFKMSQGRSVHIHCSVKLCIMGTESHCAPVTCSRRRRRSSTADGSFTTISRSLQWYEKRDGGKLTKEDDVKRVSTVSFAAIGGILVFIFIILVAMVASLLKRLRKSNGVPFTLRM